MQSGCNPSRCLWALFLPTLFQHGQCCQLYLHGFFSSTTVSATSTPLSELAIWNSWKWRWHTGKRSVLPYMTYRWFKWHSATVYNMIDEEPQHSTHGIKGHRAPYFWGGNVAPAPINTLNFWHLSKLSTTTCLWTWHSRIRPQLVQPGRFPSSPSRLESFAANDRWPQEHWSIPANQNVHQSDSATFHGDVRNRAPGRAGTIWNGSVDQ